MSGIASVMDAIISLSRRKLEYASAGEEEGQQEEGPQAEGQ